MLKFRSCAILIIIGCFVFSTTTAEAKFRIKISKRGIVIGPLKIPPPPLIPLADGLINGKKPKDIAKTIVDDQIQQAKLPLQTPLVMNTLENIAIAKVEKTLGKDLTNVLEIIVFPQQIQRALPSVTFTVVEDILKGKSPNEILGIPLATAIEQAIEHYKDRAIPIPFQVQWMLSTTFDPDLLKTARYVVDDFGGTVPAIVNKLNEVIGNEHAVTIGNIIVFSKEPSNENILFWAHELQHVHQYRRLGVKGFAGEYTLNWKSLESEADNVAKNAQDKAAQVLVVLNALAALQKPEDD